MRKIILLILYIFSLSLPFACAAPVAKTLTEDVYLHPQGWVAGSLKFKGGTSVLLNEQGEVISGILKSHEQLSSAGFCFISGTATKILISFRPDYPITFSESGEVISGVLSDPSLFPIVPHQNYVIRFERNTLFEFNSDGSVYRGTIADDCYFRPLNGKTYLPVDQNAGFLKFKSGTEIVFCPGAQVIKGTIANDLTIKGITYPAGTTLQFSESAYPQKI